MQETGTGCLKYLDLYEASWLRLVAETPRLRDYKNGSIQTTWMISYEHVCQDDATAGRLLQLWAYLHHQDVWYELFRRGHHGGPQEPDWVQDLASSEVDFKRIMKSLLAYSLIESHEGRESYSVHPVVHDWCTETISRRQSDLMVAAIMIVGSAVPGHSEAAYWLLEQRLLPHVNTCMQQIDELEALHLLESTEACGALDNMGFLCADQGKHAEAERMYQRALDGYEKAWGPDHTSTLDTINNLGNLYTDQGKHAEAERKYQRALNGQEKTWGPDHTSTLNTVNNLGFLYADQGKYAKAEEMYRRALEGYTSARGLDHPNTKTIARNLARLEQRKQPVKKGKVRTLLSKTKR